MTQALLWAAGGTGLTALLTALGAATVFFFKKAASPHLHRLLLGFAAGVMIAASVWSLLIPAIDQAGEMGMIGWLPAAGGFLLGIGFLTAMDALLPHLTPESFHLKAGPDARHRSALLVLAVTLHNIPEGMAVGISFALSVSRRARRSLCPCGRRGWAGAGPLSWGRCPGWWSRCSVF